MRFSKSYKDNNNLKEQKRLEDYRMKQLLKIDRLRYELEENAFNLANNLA